IVLLFRETFFQSAPVKRHLLEFALTASIANGTIEWMIGEEKLRHSSLGLFDLLTLCGYNHAVGTGDGAGGLEFRHLLDAHQTHTTRGLECEIRVVAE